MTELEARQVLLLRAFEQPLSTPWTADDAEAVTRQALQRLGEQTAAVPFIAERARLGVQRLAQREAAVGTALAATGPHAGPGWAVVMLAALAGALLDAVGSAQRINILAPPLFALLLWNLAVYAALGWSAVRAGGIEPALGGPLRQWLTRGLQAATQRFAAGAAAAPLARFTADWWRCGAALNTARLAALLHAAAVAFAAAAVASLYVRGLGFEYRAGWNSTFLTPASVRSLLSLLFAPALALSGGTLPDAEALARLRFGVGEGENAAGWIHLQALTLALFVVLPRGVLAAVAAWRARRLANDFALPLGDPDFARLARLPGGQLLRVDVLPYSCRLPPAALPALTAALERLHGGRVAVRLAPTVPLGGEDDPQTWSPAAADGAPTVLFALTATPERETHGAFVSALAARLAATATLHVLVDESAFRQRFTGPDGATRLEQRREAWRRMLAEIGHEPLFVDLRTP